jgi:cytidine deaminase
VEGIADSTVDAMFAAAVDAFRKAYAPYSKYRVGAAVLAASGAVFAGCNVENAAYPEGWCAETSAIAAMVLAGEQRIAAVLTVADGEPLGTCCGGCRQRIREFAGPATPVFAADLTGVRATFSVAELLPHSFGPEHLS